MPPAIAVPASSPPAPAPPERRRRRSSPRRDAGGRPGGGDVGSGAGVADHQEASPSKRPRRASSARAAARERRVLGPREARDRRRSIALGLAARELDEREGLGEGRRPEGGRARLARAEEIARAARREIGLGEPKAVRRRGERGEAARRPLARRVVVRRAEEAQARRRRRGPRARAAGAAARGRSDRRPRRS